MKRPTSFLFFALFFLISFTAVSQTTQDQLKQIRSTVVEEINGQEYYIHPVKRGQTLYRISKAYGVEVEDIIRENPQVREGLKADQKLRIPKGMPKPAAPKPAPQETEAQKPASQTTETQKPSPQKSEEQKPSTQKTEKQKPASPEEKEMPPAEIEPVAEIQKPVEKTDSIIPIDLPCGQDFSSLKPVYQVALMMPLYLAEVDQLNADNPSPDIFESSKSLQFLPFYEGVRMALDSLEKQGLHIRLFVYDIDKDTVKTKQLLSEPELKSMDLIIGLLYHRNFQLVADFAGQNKINIVNPVSERSDICSGNPYVFKVRPAKHAQVSELANYISSTYFRGQVLIVRNGKYADKESPGLLKKSCEELSLNVHLIEGEQAAIGKLSKEKENFLVFFSENPAYTLDLTRRFYQLRDEYDITVTGLPDWSAMDGLETEYLVSLKTQVMSANIIEYDNIFVKKFVQQYQEKYKSDPELLAFQGFDVAYYFLSALKAYGTKFPKCLADLKIQALQTSHDFSQTPGNGFENHHWNIYRYENYKLVKVN